VVAIYLTDSASRAERTVVRDGQITDRLSRAVDQLGQDGPDKVNVRVGGIYALARIMRDSEEDEPAVIEILCAFLRRNGVESSPAAGMQRSSPLDIKAAIAVLGGRPKPERYHLDALVVPMLFMPGESLTHVSLAGARLPSAHLAGLELTDAELSGGADLSNANLTGATLINVRFGSAMLAGIILSGASLVNVDFRGACLVGAKLDVKSATDVHLSGADLRGATFGTGLSSAALTGTITDRTTIRAETTLPCKTRFDFAQ